MRSAVLVCLAAVLYLSAGVTCFAGITYRGWTDWFGTFSAGYQYQSDGGFFVRPTMNLLYGGDDSWLLPGVTRGSSS
jgi:hypothetical protein